LHKGHEKIREIHSCFIADNNISFDTKHDFIDEKACRLIRITDIHIGLNRTRYGVIQPAHIVYDIDPSSSKVKSLKASWQINQARPFGETWTAFFISCAKMCYAFLPMTFRYGLVFAAQYCWGILTGQISGGYGLMNRLMREAEQCNEEAFSSLFFRPDSCCVRVGCAFIRPPAFLNTVWGGTKTITLLDSIKSAGWKTTAFYRRTTTSGKAKLGYVEIDVLWRNPFRSVIETAYVFEEEEPTSSG
jgi:hypothetical protein